MTFEEATEKYAIPIPEDIENYDKEVYREFDNMYLRSFYETFHITEEEQRRLAEARIAHKLDTTLRESKIAVVLGGQAGAGKSSLVSDTKRKFIGMGRRIVLIDDDQYRQLYPRSDEILKECPEYYTKLTALGTSKITPKILKFASENGYNFIFDGTMKNNRIIETMKTWEGYQIQVKVLACSRLRSLASSAIRNGELQRRGKEGRYISIDTHDETYKGTPDTLRFLESTGLASEIRIYTRGIDPYNPRLRYLSLEDKRSSADVLEELREEDEMEFSETDAKRACEYLRNLALELSEEEREEAYKIIDLINARLETPFKIIKDKSHKIINLINTQLEGQGTDR